MVQCTCGLVLLREETSLGKNIADVFAEDYTLTSRGH